jgi:hypothetical protein
MEPGVHTGKGNIMDSDKGEGPNMKNPFEPIGKAWKAFWQKNKRGKLFLVAVLGTVIALLALWELLVMFETEPLKDYPLPLIEKLDEWSWALLIVGGVLSIGGWLYYHDHNKSFKRFEELIETDSKAQFVRNIDEIEQLAVDLGPDFENKVMEKRKEFKVKTR